MMSSSLLLLGPPTISLVHALSVWTTYAACLEFPWVSKEAGMLLIPSSLILTAAIASNMAMTTTIADKTDDSSLTYAKSLTSIILSWGASAYCVYKNRTQVVVGIASIPFYGKDHLRGKTILITGANAGIGKETAFQLATMGAKQIVLLCRSQSRAEAAIAELVARPRGISSEQQFSICPCDLSDFQSIRKAVNHMVTTLNIDQADVLINNAGLVMGTQTKSRDGYEMMMQTNHLGHFLLTQLLLDQNILKEGSRIVNLTSAVFQAAAKDGFDFDDMFCERGRRKYTMLGQYRQTKLANILFTKELAKRYPKISSYAVHPGVIGTNITSNMPWYYQTPTSGIVAWLGSSVLKTPVEGAYGSVFCAAGPLEDKLFPPNGCWIHNCNPRPLPPELTAADAKRLWTVSEQLVAGRSSTTTKSNE
eukprot:scaffold8212_cov93-Cylindrotheca_fusiformis.AAC.6